MKNIIDDLKKIKIEYKGDFIDGLQMRFKKDYSIEIKRTKEQMELIRESIIRLLCCSTA